MQDTVNTGMLSPGGSADRVSSVSEVHRSDTAVNKPDHIKADVK